MTDRQQQPSRSAEQTPRGDADLLPAATAPPDGTLPGLPLVIRIDGDVDGEDEVQILGFPAEVTPADTDGSEPATGTSPPLPAVRLVVRRRADWPGGLLLVLAGVAASVSLELPWTRDAGATGLARVRQGIAVLGLGIGELGASGLWQPLAVVLGGGTLLLLGLLLLVPARSHRVVGVLALLVAVAAAAGVLVPLADAGWQTARFGLGTWFAVAVAGLGVLGALEAMLVVPRVTVDARQP